jgi:hypothetical protein
MKSIALLTVGADIEYFIQHKATMEVISAEDFVPGTKDMPYVFDETNKYFAVSLDNVLAEICIPPAKNAEEFYTNINKSRAFIDQLLPHQYCTAAMPAANLNKLWLNTPQALTFGCESDYNAYTGYRNQSPRSEDKTLRSAGLHVHLGINSPSRVSGFGYEPSARYINIVKALDLHLAIPSILVEPPNDRRKLYGKAGSFRPKSYGLEYRTLSSYLASDKEKITWVYEATKNAIEWLNSGNTVSNQLSELMVEAINTHDTEQAAILVKEFDLQTA